jgi:large subunit ribosomal protein L6
MARFSNNPVTIPANVTLTINKDIVAVKGTKGSLERSVPADVEVIHKENHIYFKPREETPVGHAITGTIRAHFTGMLKGVTEGYECELELLGVGFRAQVEGKGLNLTLGFSHPVVFEIPEGITIKTPTQTTIIVSGVNKHKVSQVAANIREYRKPEPYKGKGIRYTRNVNGKKEVITLKETKKK